MRKLRWSALALAVAGGGLAALGPTGAGCIVDNANSTGGRGAGGGGGGGTGGTGTGGLPAVTSSTGTGGAVQTHHTCQTALTIMIDGAETKGTLAGATTPDFYRFSGLAGDMVLVRVLAQALAKTNGYDPTVTDTVLTVFAAGQTPVANNNDGWLVQSTDSQLYFELPFDGTYCMSIEDCNSYALTHANAGCRFPASVIKTFDYQFFVLHTSMSSYPEINAGTTQDGTTARAAPVKYQTLGATYGKYTLDGNFGAVGGALGGTHVFSFAPPADTPAGVGQRARAEFWVQTQGTDDGDGSSAPVKVWITDDTAGQHVIARADQNDFTTGNDPMGGPLDLSLPLPHPIGTPATYYLFVESTAAMSSPSSDYYFIQHYIGDYFGAQAEKEAPTGQGMNDTPATAENLQPTPTSPLQFVIDGDVSAPGTAAKPDIDWFTITVPSMVSLATVVCEAARVGSGLGGFRAEVFAADATTSLAVLGPEAPSPKTTLSNTAIPGSNGQLYLQVRAATQAPTNAGTGYRCFLTFE
jgi:hypothetical protein